MISGNVSAASGHRDKHWPRRTWHAIALWAVLWSVLIGGVGALFAAGSINDARLRADLALHGVHTSGVVTDETCYKGRLPLFRFATSSGRPRYACAPEEYVRFSNADNPGTVVSVVYKPGHPRLLVLAPGGVVPQRDLSGIWTDWFWQTSIILLIYLPIMTAFIWTRRQKRVFLDEHQVQTSRWPFVFFSLLLMAVVALFGALAIHKLATGAPLAELATAAVVTVACGVIWLSATLPLFQPRRLVFSPVGLTYVGRARREEWSWNQFDGVEDGTNVTLRLREPGGKLRRVFLGPFWIGGTDRVISLARQHGWASAVAGTIPTPQPPVGALIASCAAKARA